MAYVGSTTNFTDGTTLTDDGWFNDVDAFIYQGELQVAITISAGDTSVGDTAAIGYTATEGLVLTGQGANTDVTIKNDADTTVLSIATGTTNVTLAGDLVVSADAFVASNLTAGFSSSQANWAQHYIGGTFSSGGGSTAGAGTYFRTTLTGHSGDSEWLAEVAIQPAGITMAGDCTVVTGLYVSEPNITTGGNTATNAATVYIINAPTEGINNYALWVDAGTVRVDSLAGSGTRNVVVDANGVMSAP